MDFRSDKLICVLLVFAGLGLRLSIPSGAIAAGFTNGAPLKTERYLHTATVLPDGKVLVAGGIALDSSAPPVELFDPATGTWTSTNGLNVARSSHTATLLPNGNVLVAGGFGGVGFALTNAELYAPATGTWTNTGSMNKKRGDHTAILRPDGKLLLMGGADENRSAISVVDVYDPNTGVWTTNGSLNVPGDTYTLLPDGKVLVAGSSDGSAVGNAELYDPLTGKSTPTGRLVTARIGHTATRLPNGRVVIAGGYRFGILSSAEVYDPLRGEWTSTGEMTTNRIWHTATLLVNGNVLVVGGAWGASAALATTELYDSLNITVVPLNLSIPNRLPRGAVEFTFTNTPDITFVVWGTTNLTAPSEWSALEGLVELSSGQYHFTDLEATNAPQRFYRVRTP